MRAAPWTATLIIAVFVLSCTRANDAIDGDSNNEAAAAAIYERAAAALMYQTKAQHVDARRLLERAATQGHAEAQSMLATMHMKGEGGLAADKEAAITWFRKAAAQGVKHAQYNLGLVHYHGVGGIAVDKAKAAEWYELAALQEHEFAQLKLGRMYRDGEGGLAADLEKASEWIGKAHSTFEKKKEVKRQQILKKRASTKEL